jgi:glycosyltransferase involved in cell wall biosynthesis
MNQEPLVSVIIPTKNSGWFVEKCLHSIMGQTYRNIEVIVVDNHSTDETADICARFGVRMIVAGNERSRQTNVGVDAAKGEIVWRTDSDCVFDPMLVFEAVRKIQGGFDAVTVRGTSDPSTSYWANVRRIEREILDLDWQRLAPCFFKKTAFQKVGGFNETLNALEESDLRNRLIRAGFKIGKIDSGCYHMGEPESISEIVAKYIYYGRRQNIETFLSDNPKKAAWQISPFRLVYLRNLRTFGVDFFPFLVYQYVRYASALIGFVRSY